MNASPSPARIAWNAIRIVWSDDAQKRLTVVPGTVSGSPASNATRRPRFMPCFSCGNPQPTITSTISSGGSSGTLSSADLIANAARSSGRASTSEPFAARPIGVRAVETITASGMPPILPQRKGPAPRSRLRPGPLRHIGRLAASGAAAVDQLSERLEDAVLVLHERHLRDRILVRSLRHDVDARQRERVRLLRLDRVVHVAGRLHQAGAREVLAGCREDLHDVPGLGDAVEVQPVVRVPLRVVLRHDLP